MNEKIIVGWSGGKDSAFALYEAQRTKRFEVVALLTTMTHDEEKISIHAVRGLLLERQANALCLPLEKMFVKKGASNSEYEDKMLEILNRYVDQDVTSMIFGDIFLEDIRHYREETLAKVGMQGIFPLWKRNTAELAEELIDCGFKAVITVVDSTSLGKAFAGREFDKQFLADLPADVDPCGENGEFHSFVYDGPNFKSPLRFVKGQITLEENRFWRCDLEPI